MKKIILLFFLMTGLFYSGSAQTKGTSSNPVKVEVYYFHPSERCPIDQSIEENSKRVVETSFPREVKEGSLKFRVVNTDDKGNEKLVSRFDINTQALYIVRVDKGKETKTDLTDFAFSFSKSNPTKFKTRLTDEIRNALK